MPCYEQRRRWRGPRGPDDDLSWLALTDEAAAASGHAREATLLVSGGPDTGRVVRVGDLAVVGRDQSAAVTLNDREVSHRHLRLQLEGGEIYADDLGSSNGTLVNGAPLTGRLRLNAGDKLTVGKSELELLSPSTARTSGPVGDLRVSAGTAAGQAIPLVDTIRIGRDPASDLVLNDHEVSRRHLEISTPGGYPVIEDVGSTNGSFVNGERITGPQRIESGDRIEVGEAVIEFTSRKLAETRVRSIAPQVTVARQVVAQSGELLGASVGARKWWTLLVVCLGALMLLVDITVVNVAIPAMAQGLPADFTDLVWVVNAYVLGLAALLLVSGSIGDIVGQRNVFGAGVVVFTLSSLTCGLAGNSTVLVASRAVQGVGGAMMFATSLALLSQEFSHRDRATAFAVWGAVSGGAVAMGPLLGGVLTDTLGWRWIFLFNVPVGVIAAIVVYSRLVNLRSPDPPPLDLPGAILLAAGLLLLTLALATGYTDGWGATHIVAEFAAAVVLLGMFVAVELRRKRPMVDLRLFADRSFSGITIAAFALSSSVFALLIYITIYLQTILGLSALGTGLTFLPMMFLAFALAWPAGKLTPRIPTRWFMTVGLLLVGLGLLLCRGFGSGLAADSSWSHLIPGFVVAGVGIGIMTPAMTSAALATVDPARAGMASGLFISARQVGTALGVAVFGAVFQHAVSVRSADALGATADTVSPDEMTKAIVNGYTPQFLAQTPASVREAVDHAARQVGGETLSVLFVLGGIVGVVGAILAFVLIRRDAYAIPPSPAGREEKPA